MLVVNLVVTAQCTVSNLAEIVQTDVDTLCTR